ncbi:hypothetical protein [Micromonospora sp. KC213]|uniref:hypothetical protein n=1 Tax=Micromonospora sp. KC213 TaxID=2530378 RepID=UPI001052757C|nr:hypothetical protein [Micromonospora sp. KC213]TDC42095.1 hypothetical protein E1166_09055 [Micromonospora sp. KC213]
MALKLGELVAYLKTDNKGLKDGLAEGRQEVRRGGRDMEQEAAATALAMAAVLGAGGRAAGEEWVRGADGKLRDGRGRFVAAGKALGDATAADVAGAGSRLAGGLLGRFGARFGAMLPDSVGKVFSGLPPQVQSVIAAAAATMAVTMSAAIGAALAAGILLAVGGGVLALGITQAVKDPAVAAAWKGFGDRAKKALAGFAEPFKEPLMRAADTFGDAIERMGPGLKEIGRIIAPVIDKLAPALVGFAEKAMPGLKDAVQQSVPLFETLARHLPEIGAAVSFFLSSIADGGAGANTILSDMLTWLEGAIIIAGWLIGSLASLYQWIRDTFSTLARVGGEVWDSIKNGASSALNWVRGKFDWAVGVVRGLKGRIGRASSGMWDGVKNSFRAALNWVISKWNGLQFRLPSITAFGQTIGGGTIGTPNIPHLATGGDVLESGLAVIHRGERILPAAQVDRLPAGGGKPAELRITGELVARGSDLVLVLRERAQVTTGGIVKLIDG